MNKKIILSLSVIVAVAAVVIGGTMSYFSDTETSTGNTFTAGAIDLQIDSTATYNGQPVPEATWALKDLEPTADKFFNFADVKPGDVGENTISLHVINNDAWVCAEVSNLASAENSCNEPELAAEPACLTNGVGELQDAMVWTVWRDDGDNVQEAGEAVLASGSPVNGVLAVYDSTTGTPLTGGDTAYLGVSWSLPSETGNEVQTDSMTGDISFNVVQSRNNGQFVCSQSQEEEQKVGANFSGYTHPTCDATVSGSQSIQAAIDDEEIITGDTVCVDNGTFTQNVDVNKSITLASAFGSSATTIDGRIKISATDVTVKGFRILGADISSESGSNGIYVVGGSNGVTISDNVINGSSQVGAQRRGIHFAAGGTTDVTVTNNVISKWTSASSTGIYLNPTAGPVSITFNDFLDNNDGIGSSSINNVTVTNNDFVGNSAEAIGMDNSAGATSGIAIHINNFTPAGAGNNVNAYGGTVVASATNNWWDTEADAARTNLPAQIDVTSPAGAAFAQN